MRDGVLFGWMSCLLLLMSLFSVGEAHNAYSAPLKWMYTPTSGGGTYVELAVTTDKTQAYLAASDEETMSQLYSIDLEYGTLTWESGIGGMGVQQPVVADGAIFSVAGHPCMLRCMSPQGKGASEWNWNDMRTSGMSLSSVAVAEKLNLVFIVSAGILQGGEEVHTLSAIGIYGNDTTRGKVVWQRELSYNDSSPDDMPVTATTPTYDATSGMVFASGQNGLYGLDALTGGVVWFVGFIPVMAPTTVTEGIVITAVDDYHANPSVKGYNASTGVHVWCMHTESVPSQASLFTDGSGRFVYSTSAERAFIGSQPAGLHVFNSPHPAFNGYSEHTDACLEGTGNIQNLAGPFETVMDCRQACQDAYCNASAFTFITTDGSCKCRVDQVQAAFENPHAVSGRWGPPLSNWSMNNDKLSWSKPIVRGETVFVNALNNTHAITMALKGNASDNDTSDHIMWDHAYEIPALTRMWQQPTPPAISESTLALLVGCQNGTLFAFCIDNTTPTPPVMPTPSPKEGSSAWYTQTRYIVGIALGAAVGLLLLCFCGCTANDCHLDSPARKYLMVSKLGSGSYGVVYLVKRRQDKALMALKYLSCENDDQQERALLEFTTMRQYQGHPNMIRVIETFMNWQDCSNEEKHPRHGVNADGEARPLISPAAGLNVGGPFVEEIQKFSNPKYVCLLMPFYKQGDLKHFTLSQPEPIHEEFLLDFTAQISSLLQHFHDRDEALIHRDMKPENILLSDDCKSVIVTDFGLAKKMANQYCCTRAGTLCYMAPECWAHHYGKEADMWALGCIMYSVAMKRLEEHNIRVMFSEALQVENFQQSIEEELTAAGYPLLATVVASLLEPDYHLRPSAFDVMQWLKVPLYNPEDPQPPVRAPSSMISIPRPRMNAPKPFAARISSRQAHTDMQSESSSGSTEGSTPVMPVRPMHVAPVPNTHVAPVPNAAPIRYISPVPSAPLQPAQSAQPAQPTHTAPHGAGRVSMHPANPFAGIQVHDDDDIVEAPVSPTSSCDSLTLPSKPLPAPVPGMAGMIRVQPRPF